MTTTVSGTTGVSLAAEAQSVSALSVTGAGIANSTIPPTKLTQPLTSGTAQATTTGTSIDFTGIPSWVKRITVMLSGVSTSGVSSMIVQVGGGSVTTTGYNSQVSLVNTGVATLNYTTGFGIVYSSQAAANYYGNMVITNITGNTWTFSSLIGQPNGTASVHLSGGAIVLGSTLDRLRLTTVNGTDTFDAGSVNIMYEG